jgi:hypothetical protein
MAYASHFRCPKMEDTSTVGNEMRIRRDRQGIASSYVFHVISSLEV